MLIVSITRFVLRVAVGGLLLHGLRDRVGLDLMPWSRNSLW